VFAAVAVPAIALTLAGLRCERLGPANAPVAIGVELPLAGDDGFRGLAGRDGVRFALARWNAATKRKVAALLCDSATHVENPHADEGSDDLAQAANGAALVSAFAAEPGIVAIVGGLRADIALAEAPVAQRESLALLSATTTPVNDATTFFRVDHSDEAEAMEAAAIAGRDQLGTPSVRSLDDARAAAFRAVLGTSGLSNATIFAGPAEVGSILADPAASDALERDGILAMMERRGFEFPVITAAAFAITPVPGIAPETARHYQHDIVAAFGSPALDDTFSYDDAMTIALTASSALPASANVNAQRAALLRALRTSTFTTLRGEIHFTGAGAADRACYAVRSLSDSKASNQVHCVKL
jgi:ABC-type branched-subunit amino acid transport system substrate-binding protein